jgi:hypothetical protein
MASPKKESMADALTCVVCFELTLPPWEGCVNGHLTCAGCRPQLKKNQCPSCRVSLTPLVRMRAVEAFFEHAPLPLMFSCSNGCNFHGEWAIMKAHEETCVARDVWCPIATRGRQCTWSGMKADLVSHLKAGHGALGYKEDEGKLLLLHHEEHREHRRFLLAGERLLLTICPGITGTDSRWLFYCADLQSIDEYDDAVLVKITCTQLEAKDWYFQCQLCPDSLNSTRKLKQPRLICSTASTCDLGCNAEDLYVRIESLNLPKKRERAEIELPDDVKRQKRDAGAASPELVISDDE